MTWQNHNHIKQFYFVRHGESESNAGGISQPHRDILLTETGHQQAFQVADWLIHHINNHSATTGHDGINSIWASEYIRTQQTAAPLLQKYPHLSLEIMPDLHEFDFIPFEMIAGYGQVKRQALSRQYWETATRETRLNNTGESFQQFMLRVQNVLNRMQHMSHGTHIIFAHGTWMAMLLWIINQLNTNKDNDILNFRLFNQGLAIKNCSVFSVVIPSHAPISMGRIYLGTNT